MMRERVNEPQTECMPMKDRMFMAMVFFLIAGFIDLMIAGFIHLKLHMME